MMSNVVVRPEQSFWHRTLTLDTFKNFLSGLGVPDRDKAVHQLFTLDPVNLEQLEAAYRGNWLSRKIVDIPAFDSCREWRDWKAEQDQIEKIEKAERSFNLQFKLMQGVARARLYGGAALIMGVKRQNWEDELDLDKVGKGDLAFVHVVGRWQLQSGPLIRDITSPWYGEPEYYLRATVPIVTNPKLQGEDQGVKPSDGLMIHPSRVVRLVGAEYPDPERAPDTWGDSSLQVVIDEVKNAGLVGGSIAALTAKANVDVIKLPGLTQLLATDKGTRNLIERFANANAAKSVVNALLIDTQDDWQQLQVSFSGLPQVLQMYLAVAAGAADIPATRLLGKAPEGMNSTGDSDLRNYYDRLSSDQAMRLTPLISRLDEVLLRNVFGERDEKISYEWAPLWQMDDIQKANVELAKSQAHQIDVQAGLISPDALRQGRENQLIEDGVYPGLEAALQEAEKAGEKDVPEEAIPPHPAIREKVMGREIQQERFEQTQANQQQMHQERLAVMKKLPPPGTPAKKIPDFGSKPKPGVARDADSVSVVRPLAYIVEDWDPDPEPPPPREPDDDPDDGGGDNGGGAPSGGVLDYNPHHEPGGSSVGGRFASISAGGSGPEEAMASKVIARGYSKNAIFKGDTIYTSNVNDAVRALYENKKVVLSQPRQVSTLINRLSKVSARMIELGGKAPHFDLCNVSVQGTNLFCAESMGIPRIEMPQMDGVQTKAFRQSLKAIGYKIEKTNERVDHLRATQRELDATKVAGVAAKMQADPGKKQKRLVISKDNYILDGHHHWAAKVGLDAINNKLGDERMKVARVNIGIIDLLNKAKAFTGGKGAKAFGEDWNPDQPRIPGGPGGGQWTSGGGGLSIEHDRPDAGGSYGLVPGDVAKFKQLKSKWAAVNNELLAHVDNPDGAESRAKLDQLEAIVKEMQGLHADPGTPAGIGFPGGPRDVTIVGAGPGGLAAGINGAAEGLDTLVVEGDVIAGGQAKMSSRIENFPGFPIGVTGEHLTQNMFEQAQRLGAEATLGTRVTAMTYDPSTGIKHLTLSNGEQIDSRTVILAGGMVFRRMEFPGSEGPGVIVGDGKALANAGAGGKVCVIGGSNGAAQAALGCAQHCDHVYVLARSPIADSMSPYQVDALRANPKITVIESDSIAKLLRDDHGNPKVLETAKGQSLPINAVGEFLGSVPDTKWISDMPLAKGGRINTNANFETSLPGVYAIGDMREGAIGRIGVAVGEGQFALREANAYLDKQRKQIAATTDSVPASTLGLITRLFALDRENPWFGQTIEDVPPLTPPKSIKRDWIPLIDINDIKDWSPDQPREPAGHRVADNGPKAVAVEHRA